MSITRDLIVLVKGDSAYLTENLYIYENDSNIDLLFEIKDNKFQYAKDSTLLRNVEGANVNITIVKPNGVEVNHVGEIIGNKVKFTITKDLTDNIEEIGIYNIQFHIGDMNAEFSIPPFNFEVKERLKGKRETPIIEKGIVDYSMVDNCVVSDEIVLFEIGDSRLNLVWSNGDIITSSKLNSMVNEINNLNNSKVDKVDGKDLSANDFTDLDKIKLHNLTNYTHPNTHDASIIKEDSIHRFVTDEDKYNWDGKSNFSGDYNDLTNKPNIINGVTPNIQVGTVTTLEPNQSVTVTRKGTDANPIFDFGIPKGERGRDGVGGGEGSKSKLLAKYVHSGNPTYNITNMEASTGRITLNTFEGLRQGDCVALYPKGEGFKAEFLPKEIVNMNNAYQKVTEVEGNSFKFDGINSFTFSNVIDWSKVVVEKVNWLPIRITNVDLSSCKEIMFRCFGKTNALGTIRILDNLKPNMIHHDTEDINIMAYGTSGTYSPNVFKTETTIKIEENSTFISSTGTSTRFEKGFWSIHGDLVRSNTPFGLNNQFNKGYAQGVKFKQGDVTIGFSMSPLGSYCNGLTIEIYDLGGE